MVAVLAELEAPASPELRCMASRSRLRPHCFSVLKCDRRCDLLAFASAPPDRSRRSRSLDLLRGTWTPVGDVVPPVEAPLLLLLLHVPAAVVWALMVA